MKIIGSGAKSHIFIMGPVHEDSALNVIINSLFGSLYTRQNIYMLSDFEKCLNGKPFNFSTSKLWNSC